MGKPRDPAETIPAFLATCCESNPHFSESVRALGQTWQRWLLLQRFPTAVRRQHGERWLVSVLTGEYGFIRHRASGNRMKVKGLALREGRFAPPLPDPTRTTIALLASATMSSLPESLQAHIPLRGATANKRPPSAEILRRFLAACCDVAPSGSGGGEGGADDGRSGASREQGESRLALRRRLPSESLTRLGLVLRWWLVSEGVAGGIDGGLVRLCSARWLRRELEHRGYSFWVGTEGYTLVSGLSLLPVWDKVPRLTHRDRQGFIVGATHDASQQPRPRRRQRSLLPPGATSTTREVPLEDALRQYADAYIESALVRCPNDSAAGVRFADLVSGFRAFLLNRHVVLRGRAPLADALRSSLGETYSGWRFRAPVSV